MSVVNIARLFAIFVAASLGLGPATTPVVAAIPAPPALQAEPAIEAPALQIVAPELPPPPVAAPVVSAPIPVVSVAPEQPPVVSVAPEQPPVVSVAPAPLPVVAVAPPVDATAVTTTSEPVPGASVETANPRSPAEAVSLPDTTAVVKARPPQASARPFVRSAVVPAQRSQAATGVPASVTIAQAILESDWGRSGLATRGFNFFGIKATTKGGSAGAISMETDEVFDGKRVTIKDDFRRYSSMEESFTDHGRFFLENPRYSAALKVCNDARAFAREIQRAGYATDPSYADKLIAIMEQNDLFQYDLGGVSA